MPLLTTSDMSVGKYRSAMDWQKRKNTTSTTNPANGFRCLNNFIMF